MPGATNHEPLARFLSKLPAELVLNIADHLPHNDLVAWAQTSSEMYLGFLPKLYSTRTLRVSDLADWPLQEGANALTKVDRICEARERWLQSIRILDVYAHLFPRSEEEVPMPEHDVWFSARFRRPIHEPASVLPPLPGLEVVRINFEGPNPTSEFHYHPSVVRARPWQALVGLRPKTLVLRGCDVHNNFTCSPTIELMTPALEHLIVVCDFARWPAWKILTGRFLQHVPPTMRKITFVLVDDDSLGLYGWQQRLFPPFRHAPDHVKRHSCYFFDRLLQADRPKDFITFVRFHKLDASTLRAAMRGDLTPAQIAEVDKPPEGPMADIRQLLDVYPFRYDSLVCRNDFIRYIGTAQFLSEEGWRDAFDERELSPWLCDSTPAPKRQPGLEIDVGASCVGEEEQAVFPSAEWPTSPFRSRHFGSRADDDSMTPSLPLTPLTPAVHAAMRDPCESPSLELSRGRSLTRKVRSFRQSAPSVLSAVDLQR